MKPIKKISDLPSIETLSNENQVLLRNIGGEWLWVGNHVEDVIPYKKKFSFVNQSVFIKNINDRLRQHLDAEYPHTYENIDEASTRAYKFVIEDSEIIGFEDTESVDTFEFDPTKDPLDFFSMFQSHANGEVAYHKVYDEESSSWRWFKVSIEEVEGFPMIALDVVDTTANPEVLGFIEDQQNDYKLYEKLLEDHMSIEKPHKVVDSDMRFSLLFEEGELSVIMEE